MKLTKLKTSLLGTLLALSFAIPATASAVIPTTGGDAIFIAPPADVTQNVTVSNDDFFVFFEGTSTLGGPLSVDISAPGIYTRNNLPAVSTLPSGMEVNSYYFHFDSVGSSIAKTVGEVVFPNDVLGIIITEPLLDASDAVVGAAGTLYPTGAFDRGFDALPLPSTGVFDSVELDVALRQLDIAWEVSFGFDAIRVITRTPEPSTYATMGLFLIAAFALKRRQTSTQSL